MSETRVEPLQMKIDDFIRKADVQKTSTFGLKREITCSSWINIQNPHP